MPPEYLTKDTFEAWASGFNRRLDDTLALKVAVDEHAVDIGVLKDRSNREDRRSAGISAAVSGAVAGVILAFKALFFGSHA
jgi:hypothetical protein